MPAATATISSHVNRHLPPPSMPSAKRGGGGGVGETHSDSCRLWPFSADNPRNSSSPVMEKNGCGSTGPTASDPLLIVGSEEDEVLRRAEFLSREEVLRRRSRRLKQLAGYYRDQYWSLMEVVRSRYRDYYWKYGRSPVDEEERYGGASVNGVNGLDMGMEQSGKNEGVLGLGFGEGVVNGGMGKRKRETVVEFHGCAFPGCKAKAMALTDYCHQHIISDTRQTLYKACTYVIKSAQSGPVTCNKPVLRSAVPSLCSIHFQKAQRHVSQALKKAGLNTSSSTRLAPKFHVMIAECVSQVQSLRKEARRVTKLNAANNKHVAIANHGCFHARRNVQQGPHNLNLLPIKIGLFPALDVEFVLIHDVQFGMAFVQDPSFS